MNIRKPVDYSAMYAALDGLMAAGLPQMELYSEIGRVISSRSEKGAAVIAAEYLQTAYPNASGFSPRNTRRMREFYRTYENSPALLDGAMEISWTQNVVILEAELTLDEKAWYIRAAHRLGWTKLELYELLRRCMLEEQTVAIAKGVIGQSEHLMALIPTQTGIPAETLFFHDEVKAMPKEPVRPELSEQELTMGKTIVGSMKEPFAPEKYHDEYRERLWEIIQAKANNQEITQAPAEQQVSVINMMDALQKMLEQATGNAPKKPRTRSKRVTA